MDLEVKEYHHVVPKMELFEEWLVHGKENQNNMLYKFLMAKFDLSGITEVSTKEVKKVISRFSSKLGIKWNESGRAREYFLARNSEWLAGDLQFCVSCSQSQPSNSDATAALGRPRKEFDALSDKSKKRRLEDLTNLRDTSELVSAAAISARSSGHRNLAAVIKAASEDPAKCKEMKKDLQSGESSRQRSLTKEEALAYYVDTKSSSHSYKQTRKWSMKVGHEVFPSFNCLRKAKADCYPSLDYIVVNETRAEIKLQAVLDKTANRLVTAQSQVLNTLPSESSFTLVSKWGCDGSSGHSTYKQKFTSCSDTDEYLFVMSFVPLQLRDESNKIVWQNPRPSSTMYCRPIKFIFAKETTALTLAETNKVLEEVNDLVPTICRFDGTEISVKHDFLLTMIDGKVCNAITETSSAQRCYICGVTPKDMNNMSKEFEVNKENLSFGISTLHAWIRCFECLLHISYRLDIKKWQVRGEADKLSVKQRSEHIQKRFKMDMGLVVDKPKPGCGNTNDGNTARRFFGNPELSADITGLDVTLIKKFDILLRTLSSGYDIQIDKFNSFAQDTKNLYLHHYSWYYMPATVHKILVHSADIIRSALLPIGQLSEEAQEARNKDCRRFREHNTRKCSRIATNRDLLNMLLITSDPVINSLREVPKKKTGNLPSEVIELIIPPVNIITNESPMTSHYHNSQDYLVDDSSEEEFSDND